MKFTLVFVCLISSMTLQRTTGLYFGPFTIPWGTSSTGGSTGAGLLSLYPFVGYGTGTTTGTGTGTTTGTTTTGTACVEVVPLIQALMGYRPPCNSNTAATTTTTTAATTCPPECLKFICDTDPNTFCNPPRAAATTYTQKCADGKVAPPAPADPTISLPCNNIYNTACKSGAPGCPADCPAPSPPGVFPPTVSLC